MVGWNPIETRSALRGGEELIEEANKLGIQHGDMGTPNLRLGYAAVGTARVPKARDSAVHIFLVQA